MALLRVENAKRYAPYIYFLREEGKSWNWISQELGISNSTCQRYLSIHKITMEDEPTLSKAIENAKSKMPSLLNGSVRQYERLLEREYGESKESAPMQKIAFDAATNILRSGNVKVLTDPKTIVEHQIKSVTSDELRVKLNRLTVPSLPEPDTGS